MTTRIRNELIELMKYRINISLLENRNPGMSSRGGRPCFVRKALIVRKASTHQLRVRRSRRLCNAHACSFQRGAGACHFLHPVTSVCISAWGRRLSLLAPGYQRVHFSVRQARTACTRRLAYISQCVTAAVIDRSRTDLKKQIQVNPLRVSL